MPSQIACDRSQEDNKQFFKTFFGADGSLQTARYSEEKSLRSYRRCVNIFSSFLYQIMYLECCCGQPSGNHLTLALDLSIVWAGISALLCTSGGDSVLSCGTRVQGRSAPKSRYALAALGNSLTLSLAIE